MHRRPQSAAKGGVPQQEFRDRELLSGHRLFQHRAFAHRVGAPAGKERHGGAGEASLAGPSDSPYRAAIATWTTPSRCPRCAAVGNSLLVRVPLMPQGPWVGTGAHQCRSLGLIRSRLHFAQNLVAEGLDLDFGLGQGGVQTPRQGPPMRDAAKPSAWRKRASLVKSVASSWGLNVSQHHPHHGQQQEGLAGEGARTTPVAFRRRFHIVFFDLLNYLEQCVGGDGGEVGRHNPQSLQRV